MKKHFVSLFLTLSLSLGMAVPAMAASVGETVTTPDGAYTLTNVVRQSMQRIYSADKTVYWVPDSGTVITFNYAQDGEMVFFEIPTISNGELDWVGYEAEYTGPMMYALSDEEKTFPERYTEEWVGYMSYGSTGLCIGFVKDDSSVQSAASAGAQSEQMAGFWASDANGWWIQYPDGSYLVDSWYQSPESGLWYYMGADGYMLTNTTTPDGYYVNADGVCQ